MPALRGPSTDGVGVVKGGHEGWSAVGSRLSSVSMPVQAAMEPGSPDLHDPIFAQWPPQDFERPGV